MSLYAEYIKERENFETLENASGFITFKIYDNELYIRDLYISYNYRNMGNAKALANSLTKLAKESHCKYLTTTVCPTAGGSTESLKVVLSYGFRVLKCHDNLIYFIKEVGE